MPSPTPSPKPSPAPSLPTPEVHSSVPLADTLTSLRALTTFSMARMHPSPLATETPSATVVATASTTVVLAPLNSAFDALPRKPWEEPGDYALLGEAAYDGVQGRDRANSNLRRFVDRHIVLVPASAPWPQGLRATSAADRTLWWEFDSHGNRVMPDRVEVDRVGPRVATGEVVRLACVAHVSRALTLPSGCLGACCNRRPPRDPSPEPK